MDYIVVSVDSEHSDIFVDFSKDNPDYVLPIEHRAFIGTGDFMDFIITLGPASLSALATYLVARLEFSKKSVKIKKGDTELEIDNVKLTPNEIMDIFMRLKDIE